MARIRDWLDTREVTLSLFTMSAASDSVVFRLTFVKASEATGFAKAFRGQVIGAMVPRAA